MTLKMDPSGDGFGYAFIHDSSGDCDVVRVYGEVDIASAPELEKTILDIMEASTAPLVLDLEPCAYLDSTTLGVIIRIHKRMPERFSIALPETGPVRKIFELTNLTKLAAPIAVPQS